MADGKTSLDTPVYGTSTGGAAGSAESTSTLGVDRTDTRTPPDTSHVWGAQLNNLKSVVQTMSAFDKGGTRLRVLPQNSNPFGASESGFYLDSAGAPYSVWNGVTNTLSQGKDLGWYNVKAYGAKGDGTTDDTSAIVAAIAACPTGGTVFFPVGTYNVIGSGSQIFTLARGIYFQGAGWGSIIQVDSSVPNTRDVLHVTGASAILGLAIRDIKITGTLGAAKAISAATNATPIAITTSSSHGYSTGQTVFISGITGNTNANGYWVITSTGANTFTLNGSVGNAAYVSGGFVQSVPGRHGINLDRDGGGFIANAEIFHTAIDPLGGRALVTTNTTLAADGIFLVSIRNNRWYGGINLSHAGDSIIIDGNTLTGGFNGVDIDSVSGAVQNVISRNNYTGQGAFVVASHAGGLQIIHNNVEPGSTGGAGVDTSNNANGAVIDIRGSVGNPVVLPVIQGNNIQNWTNWSTSGDVIRVDYGLGARIEDNDAKRSVAGPYNYKVTANAVGTQLRIPVGTDSGNYLNQVSNASTTSVTRFENQATQELFIYEGLTTTKTSRVLIQNPTAATAGVTVQNSPFLEFNSNAWNSSTLASQNADWVMGSVPVSLAGTPLGQFSLFSKTAGGGATQQWYVTNGGNMVAIGNVYAGSGGNGTVQAANLEPATASTAQTFGTSTNSASITQGRNGGSYTNNSIQQTAQPLKANATIASATTIAPTLPITHITGTTTIQTITAPTSFAQTNGGGKITLIFDGIAPWNAAGNIFVAGTPTTAGTAVDFTYDNATLKWYPSRIA